MTWDGPTKAREGSERFRSANITDTLASEPANSGRALVQEESIFSRSRQTVPEEVRAAARRKSVAETIREEHNGSGYVVLDTESGKVIGIVDDLQEARDILLKSELGADETLVVDCYDR